MKFLYLTLLFLLASFYSTAQKFEKCYGSSTGIDSGVDIASLSDQSIVSVGTSNSYGHGGNDIVITKTDISGVVLWVKYLGGVNNDKGKAVAVSTNDDIYVCGDLAVTPFSGSEDIQLTKINKHGQILWTKTYGGSSSDVVTDIIFKNNKLYMIGTTKSFGAGLEDIYLITTDTAGTALITKTLGTTVKDLGNCISQTTDGNLLIGGRSNFASPSEIFVAKINLQSDTIWTRRFDCGIVNPTFTPDLAAFAVIELTDKQILVAGTGYDNTNYLKAFHLRLDQAGNLIYKKFFARTNTYVMAVDAISTANGGYIISTNYPSGLDKYDNTGTSVWRKTYQDRYYGSGYQESNLSGRLAKLPGGKILFTGTAFLANGTKDIYIARLDSNGVAYPTPDPVITINGSATFCESDSVKLTVDAGYTSYQWVKSDNDGNRVYLPGNSNTFYAKVAGGYLCTMTKANGTRITPNITLYTNPYPVVNTIPGIIYMCAASGDTAKMATTAGYTSYQWYNNGTAINSATTANYPTTNAGSYTVIVGNACGFRTSAATTVNTNSAPRVNASCSTGDCNLFLSCGEGITLSAYTAFRATLKWYNYGFPVNTTTINQYAASCLPNVGGKYTCTATNACGVRTSDTVNVIGRENKIYAHGPTSSCSVSSVYLEAPGYLFSPSYSWAKDGVIIPGAMNSTYTATSTGSYTVYVSGYYDPGCLNRVNFVSEPVSFTADSSAKAAILTPPVTNVCSGSISLTTNISGAGILYEWYEKYSPSVILTTTPTFQATSSGTYYCRVYRSACGYQNTADINLNIGIPKITPEQANYILCTSGLTTMNILSAYTGYTYQWSFNGNSIAGATLSSYSSNITGTYTCVATNSCGTTSASVNIVSVPSLAITVTGNAALCPGQTCQLSVPALDGLKCVWTFNSSITVAENVNSINVSQTGQYRVTYRPIPSLSSSCSVTSSILTVTSTTAPATSLAANEYPQICINSPLILKAKSVINTTYNWYKNNVVIADATDSVYTATTGGTYTYTATNQCGTVTSTSIKITAKAKPVAVLTALSSTNFCNGDSVILQASADPENTYQWLKFATAINNTADFYTAKQAGNYATVITNKFGCVKKSNVVTVTVPCREGMDEEESTNVTVYPNPSNGTVYIDISGDMKTLWPEVYDAQGRLISATLSEVSTGLWMISDLDAGIYLLKVNQQNQLISKTFVVVK